MFKSIGEIKYYGTDKLVVEIDRGISLFYRSLIPKHIIHNGQRYSPHITVIRTGLEKIVNTEFWGKYDGEKIEYEYSNYIHIGKTYIWLDSFSEKLKEIRKELGMQENRIHYPSGNLFDSFHITIANRK